MIILYSTNCPKCKVLKKKLEQKNIPFIENNNIEEMKEKGIYEVPVLEKDGILFNFTEAINKINQNEFN